MLAETQAYCMRIKQLLEQSTSKPNGVLPIVLETLGILEGMRNRAWMRTTSGQDHLSTIRSELAQLEKVVESGSAPEIVDQVKKLQQSVDKMRKAYERSRWVVT
jgi:hypothetical protein